MWDVERLEAHWLACMASAAGGGRVTRLGAAQVLTNPSSPLTMLNTILLKACPPERLADLLECGRLLLASVQRPPALFLSPLSGDLPALEGRLHELGWRPRLRQVVLARRLDELPAAGAAPGSAQGPRVTVEAAQDLDAWGRLLAEAYEVAPESADAIASAWVRFSGGPGEARQYLARLEGRPVGTGLLWRLGETAGLYAGAVLPAFRRRGVERATLLYRMREARRLGAEQVFLQTEKGSPVERLCLGELGFSLAYERSLWLTGPTG